MQNTTTLSRVEKLVQVSAILTEVADEVITQWRDGEATTEQVVAITDVIDRLEKLTF